ncbi:cytochrome c biogenesis protein ResB [Galbitalea sp. SE-J8]|uniref:cytochrome c biogenesis protein ResB n=1 Tax=Galbitalea sp. SE-J8 TaxID=3054952 RepID=UPI00259D066D|nr:cytochrome c biogenesis protein ResB [Galbitalea sp. SE-J8]MDM4762394.1 cytochrome c biogenesis protein ResB [Galbitalea sp. SE-J8]
MLGWLRFFWRQLTSMRTALVLLLLLALAAVPGSLVPQRSADPNGVVLYRSEHPDAFRVLDFFQVFDTYTSAWFSAIYLLLFVSLIGCVLPRAKHHIEQLRSRPPRTPSRLTRMAGYRETSTTTDAASALDAAARVLRRAGYRVERFGPAPAGAGAGAGGSVSAERGYLRETGNLVFHLALIGVLVAVAIGGAYGFTGQRLVVVGSKFVNTRGDYDSLSAGRLVNADSLTPYRLTLDRFDVTYETANQHAIGQATDYTAHLTTTIDGTESKRTVKVNEPLDIGGTAVYLLGNGYAPVITVRDPQGQVVYSQAVPFLPTDTDLTSTGVVKIPDGLADQVGFEGLFYPTVGTSGVGGARTSTFPALDDPLLSLNVYTGDLGLDDGIPRSVYQLDVSKMTEVAGRGTDVPGIELGLGETADLPNGLGTISLDSVKRYVSLDIHHDPAQLWVGGFAVLVVLGLLTGLFIPRRRVWIAATETDDGTRLEYAGLARGEDPGLDAAIADVAKRHAAALRPTA